jgi:hypothetical protein
MNNSPRGRGSDRVRSSPDLAHLSLPALRSYRSDLREEEERVTYWRRLVHSRSEELASGQDLEPLTRADLAGALGVTGTQQRRTSLLSVHPAPLPLLPDLSAPWAQEASAVDTTARREAARSLADAQVLLEDYRQAVHARLAAATGELIARYINDPTAAFDLVRVDP